MNSQYHPYLAWVEPVKLLASGRAEMHPDEVELISSVKSNFYDDNQRLLTEELCILTSQRLIFLPKDTTRAFAFPIINHYRVTSVEPWFKTPKITFHLRDNSNDAKIATPQEIDALFNPSNPPQLQPRQTLTIGIKESKVFHSFLTQIDQAKMALIQGWKVKVEQKAKEQTANYGTTEQDRVRSVGVTGILNQRKEKAQQQQTQLSEAGADLDSLMKHAQQVTGLLEKLSQRALHQQQNEAEKQRKAELQQSGAGGDEQTSPTSGDDTNDLSVDDQANLTNVLEQMGFISPVTKQSSGNRFHEELSRQLFDFAQRPVQVSNGNIGLIDLYCLYNRARGTELVSPQDVLKACQLWEKFFPANPGNNQNSNRVSLRLKQLKSGAYIIQSSRYNENSERMRIQQYIYARNCGLSGKGAQPREIDVPDLWKVPNSKGVDTMEISQVFKLSLQMAQEQLDVLEKDGKVLKDNGPAAVLYFHNFFAVSFLEF